VTIPGAGVVQRLTDFVLHPTLGTLTPCLDGYGPYEGNVTIEKWYGGPGPVMSEQFVTSTHGVFVQLHGTIPPEWGYTKGWVSPDGNLDAGAYTPALAQVVVAHQLLTGLHVLTQVTSIETLPWLTMWDVAVPSTIGILVAPRLKVDLYWLCVG